MNPNQALSVLVCDWMKRQRLSTRAAAKRLCYEGLRIPHEIFYALVDEEDIYA